MADTPFKIQMNQDGAILKTSKIAEESFLVVPDYIKLEKASYPRMTVNPIEPWTEEEPPPEDYGKNVIDTTLEEDWYYTFYCDSVEWDGREETLDKSGNGSKEKPWRNFWYAVCRIYDYMKYTCCESIKFLLKLSGNVSTSLNTSNVTIDFNYKLVIDCSTAKFKQADNRRISLLYHIIKCYFYNFNILLDSYNSSGNVIIQHNKFYNVLLECSTKKESHTITFRDCYIDTLTCNNAHLEISGEFTDSRSCVFSKFNCFARSVRSNVLLYSNIETVRSSTIRISIDSVLVMGGEDNYTSGFSVDYLYRTSVTGYYYSSSDIRDYCYDSDFNIKIRDNGVAIYNYGCIFSSLFNIVIYDTHPHVDYDRSSGIFMVYSSSLIKDSKIEVEKDISLVTYYALVCPLDNRMGGAVYNCELIGYKSFGDVPEDARCGI